MKGAGPAADARGRLRQLLRDGSAWFRHPPGPPGGQEEGSDGVTVGGLRWFRVFLASAALSLLLSGFLWYVVIPYPWTLASRNPARTALMEQRIREAERQGDTLIIQKEWLPLSEISPNLVRAVVVAEDYRFREHNGVDWVSLAEEVGWTGDQDFSWWSTADLSALARALGVVWSRRDELRGRSTLTQQLAKNLYFGTERTLVRKVLEVVVARRLEGRLGKDRILELYLNLVEWGPGIFGAEAAARHYFQRSARDLTLGQAAALAGTLPHPLTSNPAHNPGRMRWRQDLILDRLLPDPEPPVALPEPDTARADSSRADTLTAGGGAPDPTTPDTTRADTATADTTTADTQVADGSVAGMTIADTPGADRSAGDMTPSDTPAAAAF